VGLLFNIMLQAIGGATLVWAKYTAHAIDYGILRHNKISK